MEIERGADAGVFVHNKNGEITQLKGQILAKWVLNLRLTWSFYCCA
jgi:hypothetical protein